MSLDFCLIFEFCHFFDKALIRRRNFSGIKELTCNEMKIDLNDPAEEGAVTAYISLTAGFFGSLFKPEQQREYKCYDDRPYDVNREISCD